MNAILASTSALAIATGFYQPTAKVIPFTPRAAPEAPATVEETANDNEPVMPDDDSSYDSDGIDALEESYADEPEPEEPADAEPPAKVYAIGASALIERAIFTRAVEIVGNVVDKRNTIPILDNVMLKADEQEIIITGTDLDIEIQVRIPAAIDDGFSTTLPAHLLKGLLKKATASDYVAIKTGEDRDYLDFERVQYTLNPLPANDFPELKAPNAETAASFELVGAKLWAALDSTKGAISTEETRYYLNGVYLHVYGRDENSELRMVATDGHRLYCQSIAMPEIVNGFPANSYSGTGGVIIPRHLVDLLHKLLKGKACPESVAIAIDAVKSRFSFMLGDCHVIVTGKHIDGTFPDYGRVVPAHNALTASFKVADMQEALRAVSLISSERGRAARYTFSDGKCDLYVTNPEHGSASASISCGFSTDEEDRTEIIIGFNSVYMAEILSVVEDGEVATLRMSEPGNPSIVTGDREGWFAVLMPMRV